MWIFLIVSDHGHCSLFYFYKIIYNLSLPFDSLVIKSSLINHYKSAAEDIYRLLFLNRHISFSFIVCIRNRRPLVQITAVFERPAIYSPILMCME